METKDLLKVLDIEDVKDLEAFKKSFSEKFIPKSQAMDDDEIKSKITGKIAGSLTTIAKREFGLTSEEVKGKPWEEVISMGVTKQNARIKELEESSSKDNDAKVLELTGKLDKAKKEASDFKSMLDKTSETLTTKETEFNGKIKEFKVGSFIEKSKEKVSPKLKKDLSIAEKLGFEAKLKDFTFDLNDKDEFVVLSKDGKMVPNPDKMGAFLSPDELIERQAIELNLIAKNNGGTGVNPGNFLQSNTNTNANQNTGQLLNTGRTVNPAALKHAEALKAQAGK